MARARTSRVITLPGPANRPTSSVALSPWGWLRSGASMQARRTRSGLPSIFTAMVSPSTTRVTVAVSVSAWAAPASSRAMIITVIFFMIPPVFR